MYIIIIGWSAAGVTLRRCKAKTLLQHTTNTHTVFQSAAWHRSLFVVQWIIFYSHFKFCRDLFVLYLQSIVLTDSHTSAPQQRWCTTIVTESIVFSSRHIIYILQPLHNVIVPTTYTTFFIGPIKNNNNCIICVQLIWNK